MVNPTYIIVKKKVLCVPKIQRSTSRVIYFQYTENLSLGGHHWFLILRHNIYNMQTTSYITPSPMKA